jgi:hypothetical protein
MDKIIKIIVLSSGKTLITQIVEFDPIELGAPDWRLINPYSISNGDIIEPWLESCTDQTEFKIVSDIILTAIEPNSDLLEKYLEKIN